MNPAMLYIEDNEDNISLVRALLKRRPQIELHIAMTGRDGIQAAVNKQPGLILLDNRLPDATGREVLATACERSPRPSPWWWPTAATPTRSSTSCSPRAAGVHRRPMSTFGQFMAIIDRSFT